MNYQFIRNLTGQPEALFEMGNEAFSRWFSEELGQNQLRLSTLFDAINKLEQRQIKQFVLPGNEFCLSMDQEEVELRANLLEIDGPDELPEGTELYDQESMAGCGLEDFKQVLYSWSDFVAEK